MPRRSPPRRPKKSTTDDESRRAHDVVLEQINSQLTTVLEATTMTRTELRADMVAMERRLGDRLTRVEEAVTTHSGEIRRLEDSVTAHSAQIAKTRGCSHHAFDSNPQPRGCSDDALRRGPGATRRLRASPPRVRRRPTMRPAGHVYPSATRSRATRPMTSRSSSRSSHLAGIASMPEAAPRSSPTRRLTRVANAGHRTDGGRCSRLRNTHGERRGHGLVPRGVRRRRVHPRRRVPD